MVVNRPEVEAMGEGETGVPASIEAAWGMRERASRGPKRGLSLAKVVDAGVRVASAEGLGAVSMSRVAAELGVSTMAPYRYIAAKEELLALMVDAALGQPPGPEPGEDWRAGLNRWASGVLARYREHPWALRVPISGVFLYAPNQVAWLERGLVCLVSTGLTEREKPSVVLLVSGFVRNYATLTADLNLSAGQEPDKVDSYGRVLTKLIDPARFPAVIRAIGSGTFDDEDEDFDAEFDFGLDRILDGIGVLIEERNP